MSWRWSIAAVLAGAVALTCTWIPGSMAGTPDGTIAFDGDGRIHTFDPEDPAATREVVPADMELDAAAWQPDLSPDGASVAFVRTFGDSSTDVWTMGVDGSGPTQLTSGRAYDTGPDWSPDGKWIAFSRTPISGWSRILVMRPDGSDVRRLFTRFGHVGEPEWSPNGKRIAFTAEKGEDWDVYSIKSDGSGLRRLTTKFGNDMSPTWSPDGSLIAFAGYERSRTYSLYVIEPDGGAVVRLALDECGKRCNVEAVEWSPDGSVLAVAYGTFDGPSYVITVDPVTGVEEQILTRPHPIYTLSWVS